MTFEQLRIFAAVAEREHLTQAASALRLTPSAVSAAIKSLENFYGIHLFDRVGRGIRLTREGGLFLHEAKGILAKVKSTEALLAELGNLKTGSLDIQASQTIANYWLPQRLLAFSQAYPGIAINVAIGNTASVAAAVVAGDAEFGFIEGFLDEPTLALSPVGADKLVVVASASQKLAAQCELEDLRWIMREPGSGTRSVFERSLRDMGIDPNRLDVALVLPSNEALLTAVMSGSCVTALSENIVKPFIENGQLQVVDLDLPLRRFTLLRHKERHLTAPARKFEPYCHI